MSNQVCSDTLEVQDWTPLVWCVFSVKIYCSRSPGVESMGQTSISVKLIFSWWIFFCFVRIVILTTEIKSFSADTQGMHTMRRCRPVFCFSLIVTLHARLFNILSSQSLMEIGSFSEHNDELCWVKGALSARTFSSFCLGNQDQKSNGERSDF